MAYQTHYDVLNVSRDADAATIKTAYLRIVRETHPDSSDTQDATRFDEATKAYEVLRSPDKRATYDLELRNRLNDNPLPEARSIWVSFVGQILKGEQ